MSWWRDILRVLGLTTDARVHISAPDIEVVLTGEAEDQADIHKTQHPDTASNQRRAPSTQIFKRSPFGAVRAPQARRSPVFWPEPRSCARL